MTNQKVLRAHDFLPPTFSEDRNVLTVAEVAAELRCSKAHIHHLIAGKVRGVRPLPSLWLGRRRLILRASFDEWIACVEKAPVSGSGGIHEEPAGAK
jgi:excisionase family DNA binding protein